MTKRGLSNRSDREHERWYDVPGLIALVTLIPALAALCLGYIVVYAAVYGSAPW